jgi:hypothetical protein
MPYASRVIQHVSWTKDDFIHIVVAVFDAERDIELVCRE